MQKILDNKAMGSVGETIQQHIKANARITIMSAYFTIYAFHALKKELSKVESVKFLFTEPTFTNSKKYTKREQGISGFEDEAGFRNQLTQNKIAKECAQWLREKVDVKSFKISTSNMSVINAQNSDDDYFSVFGNTDFRSSSLGFTYSNAPLMANSTDDSKVTKEYVQWFNTYWNDSEQTEDVKEELLRHLEVLYQDHTPEFIYFITLYHIFRDYLNELQELHC